VLCGHAGFARRRAVHAHRTGPADDLPTRSVEIPIIVDADTGFGEPLNVHRTIVELEAAGAAAIQLEDQRLPKRCGHLSGKSLVEAEEMCAKLRAAAGARSESSLVILARTDARSLGG